MEYNLTATNYKQHTVWTAMIVNTCDRHGIQKTVVGGTHCHDADREKCDTYPVRLCLPVVLLPSTRYSMTGSTNCRLPLQHCNNSGTLRNAHSSGATWWPELTPVASAMMYLTTCGVCCGRSRSTSSIV